MVSRMIGDALAMPSSIRTWTTHLWMSCWRTYERYMLEQQRKAGILPETRGFKEQICADWAVDLQSYQKEKIDIGDESTYNLDENNSHYCRQAIRGEDR